MEVAGDPNFPREISCVRVLNERKQRFEGPEKVVPQAAFGLYGIYLQDFGYRKGNINVVLGIAFH
jgi:hypothetical protein